MSTNSLTLPPTSVCNPVLITSQAQLVNIYGTPSFNYNNRSYAQSSVFTKLYSGDELEYNSRMHFDYLLNICNDLGISLASGKSPIEYKYIEKTGTIEEYYTRKYGNISTSITACKFSLRNCIFNIFSDKKLPELIKVRVVLVKSPLLDAKVIGNVVNIPSKHLKEEIEIDHTLHIEHRIIPLYGHRVRSDKSLSGDNTDISTITTNSSKFYNIIATTKTVNRSERIGNVEYIYLGVQKDTFKLTTPIVIKSDPYHDFLSKLNERVRRVPKRLGGI